MSQSLGQLHVDLSAETGSFVSALSKAAYTAQQTSKEISRSFGELREVAEQTFGAFGEFNPIISKLSFALETAGRAASSAMKEFTKLGGAAGGIGAGLAAGASLALGAAALLVGVDGILIALAAHAAESAAKMYELSQATGVPVSTLSGLSFAAKAAGVDLQTLATGLERMSKSAFAAATATAGAANAYTRLGISVRDAAGNIRPTADILLDLADKFSKMPDGIEKTSAALQLFGRGGASLIPFLNEGKAAIADLKDYAERVGAVLSGDAAAGAHEFERSLTKIGIAVSGAENRLMVDLLPALNTIVEALARVGSDGQPAIVSLIDKLAFLVKASADVGATFLEMADQIGGVFLFLGEAAGALVYALGADIQALSQALTFDFSGAKRSLQEGTTALEGVFTEFISRAESSWKSYEDFLNGIHGTLAPRDLGADLLKYTLNYKKPVVPSGPGASGRPDVVAELVAKLQAQASAELALASATEKSTAATLLAKAAGEAEIKIAETRSRLLEQEKSLREQLADANRSAAAGESSGGERALKIQAEVAGIQKMLAELQKDAPQITSLFAEIAAGTFASTTAKDLQDAITKTREEGDAARDMAAAYTLGGEAIQKAVLAEKLAPFENKLRTITALIEKMKTAGIPTGTVGTTSAIGSLLGNLETARDQTISQISQLTSLTAATESSKVAEGIAKETRQLEAEAKAYQLVANAAFSSLEAQRQAAALAAAIKFGASKEGIGATPDQLYGTDPNKPSVYQEELAKQNLAHAQTISQAAAEDDLNASYKRELQTLLEIREVLAHTAGASTIGIDLKINDADIAHQIEAHKEIFELENEQLLNEAKLYDSAIQLALQWDKAALEVGSLGDKFKAVSDEIQIEGQNLGEHLAENFKTAVDDMSGQLAKFIVTGKGSIREFFDSLAENALKSTFQYSFSKLFAGITGAAPTGAPAGVGPGGTAGTFPGLAGALGLKLPGAPGVQAPSSVATMNIAAQIVNLSGSPALGGATGSTGAADGSSAAPWYSIFTDSTGNPYGVGNALPIVPSGGGSPFTEALPITGADNQRAFAASGILGLPGLPGGAGAPGANPSLLTSVAGGAGIGGANGTAGAPFYVVSALGPLGGLSSSAGGSPLGGVPGQDTYGNAVFGAGAGPGGTPPILPASGASGGFIGTILKLFGIGASTTSPGGGVGGAVSGAGGGAAGAASSTAAATTMQAAATLMQTAATTMTTAAATMQSAAATMSASASSSGAGGGGGLLDLLGGGGADAAGGAGDLSDLADLAELAAFSTGGRVTKGVPYIVGEDRPEVFVPDQSGRIVRSLPDFENSSVGREMSHRLGGVDFSKISHRESGGSVIAGVPYLAGEKRPEVFVPNSFSGSAPRAGGGVHHHYQNTVIQNIQTPDADSFRKSQDQLHAEAFAAMRRASYRNG